jgi:hypothetical protein
MSDLGSQAAVEAGTPQRPVYRRQPTSQRFKRCSDWGQNATLDSPISHKAGIVLACPIFKPYADMGRRD